MEAWVFAVLGVIASWLIVLIQGLIAVRNLKTALKNEEEWSNFWRDAYHREVIKQQVKEGRKIGGTNNDNQHTTDNK